MNVPMKHVFRKNLVAGLVLLGSIQLHASILCCNGRIADSDALFDFATCGGITCGFSGFRLTPGVGVQVGSNSTQGVTLTATSGIINPSATVNLGNAGTMHAAKNGLRPEFVYLDQPASLAGNLTFTFNGFTLSSIVIQLNANPAKGGITITALRVDGTAIEHLDDPLSQFGSGGILPFNGSLFYTISEDSSVLAGLRISNGDAVVLEGGNSSGVSITAAAPEPGSAVLIFAAMLLFALRALAQRYCLWRDQWARHR